MRPVARPIEQEQRRKMERRDDTLRSFISVEIDGITHHELGELQDRLIHRIPRSLVKWVATDSIHLTLKFLGATRISMLEKVENGMERAVQGIAPFEFRVSGIGCFPNCRRPRVVWVGVEDESGGLSALQSRIESEMEALGWEPEKRSFSPHLTLGRVRKGLVSTEIAHIGKVISSEEVGNLGVVPVSSVVLMKSVLSPQGAKYELIYRAGFR